MRCGCLHPYWVNSVKLLVFIVPQFYNDLKHVDKATNLFFMDSGMCLTVKSVPGPQST